MIDLRSMLWSLRAGLVVVVLLGMLVPFVTFIPWSERTELAWRLVPSALLFGLLRFLTVRLFAATSPPGALLPQTAFWSRHRLHSGVGIVLIGLVALEPIAAEGMAGPAPDLVVAASVVFALGVLSLVRGARVLSVDEHQVRVVGLSGRSLLVLRRPVHVDIDGLDRMVLRVPGGRFLLGRPMNDPSGAHVADIAAQLGATHSGGVQPGRSWSMWNVAAHLWAPLALGHLMGVGKGSLMPLAASVGFGVLVMVAGARALRAPRPIPGTISERPSDRRPELLPLAAAGAILGWTPALALLLEAGALVPSPAMTTRGAIAWLVGRLGLCILEHAASAHGSQRQHDAGGSRSADVGAALQRSRRRAVFLLGAAFVPILAYVFLPGSWLPSEHQVSVRLAIAFVPLGIILLFGATAPLEQGSRGALDSWIGVSSSRCALSWVAPALLALAMAELLAKGRLSDAPVPCALWLSTVLGGGTAWTLRNERIASLEPDRAQLLALSGRRLADVSGRRFHYGLDPFERIVAVHDGVETLVGRPTRDPRAQRARAMVDRLARAARQGALPRMPHTIPWAWWSVVSATWLPAAAIGIASGRERPAAAAAAATLFAGLAFVAAWAHLAAVRRAAQGASGSGGAQFRSAAAVPWNLVAGAAAFVVASPLWSAVLPLPGGRVGIAWACATWLWARAGLGLLQWAIAQLAASSVVVERGHPCRVEWIVRRTWIDIAPEELEVRGRQLVLPGGDVLTAGASTSATAVVDWLRDARKRPYG